VDNADRAPIGLAVDGAGTRLDLAIERNERVRGSEQ